MLKFERLSVDNDFIHTDGIWQADVANIDTKELEIEATENEFKTRTAMEGFSLTFAPRSILSRATGALSAVQIVDSEGFQRSTVFNTTGFNFGRGQITVDNVRLHGGTIAGVDLDVEIERDLLVEYFVNTSESWSRSHSVGFDLSAAGSLGMNGLPSFRTPFDADNLCQLGATLSTPPTVRAEHIESIHQTYSDASIKTSKGFNVSGQTTELKPDLKNEDKIKVFDSSIINSIGENLSAVGQLRESLHALNDTLEIERLKAKTTQKINLYSVVKQTVVETVVVEENYSEQDSAPQTEENRVVSLGVEALIDDLSTPINIDNLKFLSQAYFENINENQSVKRSSSPEPVDTELRKAEKAAVDTMCKIADKWNAVKPHTGPYTKAVAEVVGAVSKAMEPVNEFIINPALKYLNTGVRRGLRDGCGVSQGLAQDIGDIASITAGILILGTTAKVISNGGKLVEFNKLLKEPNAGKLRLGNLKNIEEIREAQRKVGNVGKFGKLTDKHGMWAFNDGKEVHHFPAQKYLKANGLDTNDALSIVLTKEQHAKTRTFKRRADKIDLNSSYRDELSRDIKDIKRILKEDGAWNSEIRQSLLKGLDNFRKEYPQLFEKVNK